ncbi:MAG: tetratricopeptide repeat-containing protein [Chloroflexi bacterium]|nr:tetratricopeptide repeat-containing protein [Chloroflexota bacterium]MBM3175603.1 tetratricopeptide repeat-containing protein [Chloroflexota bacterium]
MAKNISAKASFLDEIDRHFDYIGNHYEGEPNNQILELHKCAGAFCQRGKFEKAIQYYQAILKLCQELNDRNGEGISYIKLGCAYGKWHQHLQGQRLAGKDAQLACRSGLEEAAYYCDRGIQFFRTQGTRWEELAVLLILRGMCCQGLACLEDHEEWAQEYWGKARASFLTAQNTLSRADTAEWEEPPWQEHFSKITDEAVQEFDSDLRKKPSRPASLTIIPICPEAKYLRQPHWQWENEKHDHIETWNLCVGEEEFSQYRKTRF